LIFSALEDAEDQKIKRSKDQKIKRSKDRSLRQLLPISEFYLSINLKNQLNK
jgi:hypothetical protein